MSKTDKLFWIIHFWVKVVLKEIIISLAKVKADAVLAVIILAARPAVVIPYGILIFPLRPILKQVLNTGVLIIYPRSSSQVTPQIQTSPEEVLRVRI